MTDNIQYVCLTIYLFALVSLFTYGMNCYLLMIFYRLKRPKALKQHAAIKKNFTGIIPSRIGPGLLSSCRSSMNAMWLND
jgi:hypothetical protein